MFPTRVLLSHSQVRLTLFTRPNCSLCDTAKRTVTKLRKHRKFDYLEMDIMMSGNKAWKDVYELDVPVLHVQVCALRSSATGEPITVSEPRKLFHRFTEQEVEKLVNTVEEELPWLKTLLTPTYGCLGMRTSTYSPNTELWFTALDV